MVPPLCYKHNDIHSELINAPHFSRASEGRFPPRHPRLPAARGDGGKGTPAQGRSPSSEPAPDELGEKTRLGLIKVLNTSRLRSNFQINYGIFS